MPFRATAADDRVRRILIENLYAKPSGVLIATLCGLLTAWGAAVQAHSDPLTISATILSIIAVLRVAMAFLIPRLSRFDTRALERIYEIGAFSYAGMCGGIAAQSIFLGVQSTVQTLTVGNAISYGVAMASRNASEVSAVSPDCEITRKQGLRSVCVER